MPTDAPNRTPATAKPVYHFGEFEVWTDSGEVFRNGSPLHVQEQSLQVLLALLENPGAVVSRDQLRERLWPNGTYVDFEHSLNAAVKRLRAALGDDADSPRFIETLPKRGYRLLVNVFSKTAPASTETPVSPVEVHRRTRWRPVVIAATLLLLSVVVILALYLWRRTSFGANASSASPPPPQNAEAYELYLRSLGYKYEFPANRQAIDLVERCVVLDSRSARTWHELARRYNIQFTNGGGGRSYFEQAREANRRALELAPSFVPARSLQVLLDVEGGEVIGAYQNALTLTQEKPQDPRAHLALSHPLRYGGMFEESAAECERARQLDPSNPMLSCALVNEYLGRYDAASAYIDTDRLSHLAHFRRMEIAILKNDRTTALAEARAIFVDAQGYPDARLMEAALSGGSSESVRNWSQEDEALNDRITLAELHFVDARYQSWAGQTEPALRLLRRAIANNYCSYPVIDSDPFLANVRKSPEFKQLRQSAIACREKFRLEMQGR